MRYQLRRSLLTLALCCFTFGCSSGDGNEDIVVIGKPLQATYTTEIEEIVAGGGVAPGAPFVSLEDGGSPADKRIRIEVLAVGLTDLWAVAFTLEYDPAVLDFISSSESNGGFLDPSSSNVEVLAAPELGRPDHLVVSASKLRQDPTDTGSSGTGTIFTLDFDVVGIGSSTISYVPLPANTAAIDSADQVTFGISRFYGGSLEVR